MTCTSLQDRIALVTGAGGGIGRAIAIELARRGAHLALHYHQSRGGAEETAALVSAQDRRTLVVGGDLTHSAEATRVIATTVETLGGLDILVNNAGDLVARTTLLEMSDERWRQVLDLNVTSAFYCARAAVPHMQSRGRGGAIVNMSSLAGHNGGGPGAFAYAASKAAVVGLTRGIAKELAPLGIRVNAVAPGLIGQTAFHARYTAEDIFQATERTIPLGRAGTPEDVATVVAFLASDESAFVVGETIDINGGAWFR
jgi:3-oxoacyl-[acyl-carrier protein] reductase